MTEQEWLVCQDPQKMLDRLQAPMMMYHGDQCFHQSERKLRLYAVACARATGLFAKDDGSARLAVSTAERFADGARVGTRMAHFAGRMHNSTSTFKFALLGSHCCESDSGRAAKLMTLCDDGPPDPIKAVLLREIIGNPFRPLPVFTSALSEWHGWITPTVLAMAQYAYDERNFSGLPAIADAMEEGGCTEDDILMHLRGEELRCGGSRLNSDIIDETWYSAPLSCPHFRGCHVLDAILGLS